MNDERINGKVQKGDFSSKIELAMSGIADDAVGRAPAGIPRPAKRSGGKSARPRQIAYVPMDEEDDGLVYAQAPVRKKPKALKITGIVTAMVLVVAACAYGGISYYYSDKFFEGTYINGVDCSGKTAYEVEQAIAAKVGDYSIQVVSRDMAPQVIDGSQINYRYMSDGQVLRLLEQQKPYRWVDGFFQQRSYTTSENIAYDRELLQTEIKQLDCAKPENQVAPQDAYVAFNNDHFDIVPETQGSTLDVRQAYRVLETAVAESRDVVDFTSEPDTYVKADVTQDDTDLRATLEACNNFTKASITYTFGDDTVVLDGSTIKDWLHFDENNQLVHDDASFQQHISDFVAELAYEYDTVGTEREFQTTDGRIVYVYGSAYGWQIDQAAEIAQLTSEIQSGAQVTRDPIYSMTANSHGYNDFGDTYIEVDMGVQHMYYYQYGDIIFDSPIVSGNPNYGDRATPTGVYTLYYKKSPEVLKGRMLENGEYEYETPVTYWMPFNGGVGFHDATWQPDFGGDVYLWNGSHGCINLPYESAAILYDIIQYDVPIICFY